MSEQPRPGGPVRTKRPLAAQLHLLFPGESFARRPAVGSRQPGQATRRIVIVEDNAENRQMLRSLLELSGHQVADAADGRTGLATIRATRPEIALVDIGLPGMDGYEAARQVRSLPECDAVCLVALTGYDLPRDRQQALEAGFDFHLDKPVDFEELNAFLAHGVSGLRRGDQPRWQSSTRLRSPRPT